MASNLTFESLDFDAIRRGDDEATGDAIEFMWLALNDQSRLHRQGIRLAVDRSERRTIAFSPSAAVHNYDIGNASYLRFDGAVAVDLTGLLAPSGGASRLLVVFVLGSATITIKHNNAGSEEPNRILTESGGDVAVTTNKAVALVYQDARWRELKWA